MKLLTSMKLKKTYRIMIFNILKKSFTHCILLILCNVTYTLAQGYSDTRNITRSFAINRETNVEISNKYGNMNIETWNYDSVKVVITASTTAPTLIDLNLAKKNVDFQFINTEHYVSAKTIIINPTQIMISDLKSIFNKGNTMNIEYKIFIPKTLNIKIENRYGDIYANSLAGNITINQAYGKLKLNQVDGQLNLNLDYVDNAEIEKITRGDCDFSFSNVHVKHISSMKLKSRFSKIDIDDIDDLQIISAHDQLSIANLKSGEFTNKYSQVTIDNLENSVICDAKYGFITFRKTSPTLTKINIGSKYTDVNIYFDAETVGFETEINNRKSRIVYPRIYELKEETINLKECRYRSTGHIGKASNSNIFIDASYGTISFKQK